MSRRFQRLVLGIEREEARDSALDAGKDDGQVVGTDRDADRSELRGLALGFDGVGEPAAVGQENMDDL
jgi:hypothetical protein